jgi:hypothetical protein
MVERCDRRFLQRFFRDVEVTGAVDQRGEHQSPLPPEQVLELFAYVR